MPLSFALGCNYKMENVYSTPQSSLRQSNGSGKGRTIAIWGSILQAPIYLGFFAFSLGVVLTFQAISIYGAGDPKAMAAGLSTAMSYSIIGSIFSLPGLLLTFYVLFKTEYRSAWFKVYNIITIVFWVLSIPVGTIIGVIYIVILFITRKSKVKNA